MFARNRRSRPNRSSLVRPESAFGRRLSFERLEDRALLAGVAELVKDTSGGDVFNPRYLTDVNGRLYFVVDDSTNGEELWRINSSGKAELVEDAVPGGGIRPGNLGSIPRNLTNVNGTLYFTANDGANGVELWRINSSGQAETVEDSAIADGGINPGSFGSDPARLANVGGTLYFVANDGPNGFELWRINSTSGLAEMVEDAAAGGGIAPFGASSDPGQLTNVNGTLYFTANDGTNGVELWRINGSGQAQMVEDGAPGVGINPSGDAGPLHLTPVSGTLYFSADDGSNGRELWRINGSGTAQMIEDGTPGGGINPSGSAISVHFPPDVTSASGVIYFMADDGTNGRELWRNNNLDQAEMVDDGVLGPGIHPSGSALGDYVVIPGTVDPPSPPQYIPRQPYLTDMGGTLYFAADDGTNGRELWRVNTSDEAERVERSGGGGIDLASGVLSLDLFRNPYLTPVNGTLYFRAYDALHSDQLWRINNSGEGEMVAEQVPSGNTPNDGFAPRAVKNINGTLYYSAQGGGAGQELWRVNTSGLEEMVEDSVPGGGLNPSGDSSPSSLTNAGGTIYFSASDGTGPKLWQFDPTDDLVATMDGSGNLTVTDVYAPGDKHNNFIVSIVGPNLVISDTTERFRPLPTNVVAAGGVLSNDNKTLTIPIPTSLLVQGQGGLDAITLNGTAGADVLVLSPGSGIWDGDGYLVYLLAIENVSSAGGTNDAAYFYDSPGVDTFVATPTTGTQTDGSYVHQVSGFGLVNGVGVVGGQDVAYLYGDGGNDTFVGRVPDFHMTAPGYRNQALFFESVTGVAMGGANDIAYMYGSSGNDTFVATETHSFLAASTHFLQALGFDEVVGVAGSGGTDVAHFHGTADNDIFAGQVGNSFLSNSSGGFQRGLGFKAAHFYANSGGSDQAYLYDSPGSDVFTGSGQEGRLSGPDYDLFAHGFGSGDVIRAIKTQGGTDDVQLGAVNYIFQQIGAWV